MTVAREERLRFLTRSEWEWSKGPWCVMPSRIIAALAALGGDPITWAFVDRPGRGDLAAARAERARPYDDQSEDERTIMAELRRLESIG